MAALLVIAAVALGLAIHLKDGEYTPVALALVTLALVASIVALVRECLVGDCRLPIADCRIEDTPSAPPFGIRQPAIGIVSLGLALQLGLLFSAWPGADLPPRGGWQLLPFYAGLSAAVVLIAGGLLVNSKPAQATWFPLLLLAHLLLGLWMVHSSPSPHIDVWMFQQKAAAELLHGRNPYAMTFPDIYHSALPGSPQQVYGDVLVVNDRLQFGFPYPPVSLLLATIGYAVAGDCRYAQVVALVLAGAFIGYCRPGRIAKLAAALLLFTPRVFYVLGRGWTEPFGILLLAATIFCACRRSRLLPIALGLLLATKQYMVLAVPLTYFLLPRSNTSAADRRWKNWVNLLWKAALAAAIITLPLALWDFGAFWKSTIAVQELAPFRWDALSFLVLYGKARAHFHALDYPIWFVSRKLTVTDPLAAVIWSTSAAIVMLIFSLSRAPRAPAGFAASLALISLAFFAFNKQAFCNYYFFVIGAMCCGVACAVQGQKSLTTENTEDTERMPEINGPQMNTDEHRWK